jgi:predicted peroxiredoxin
MDRMTNTNDVKEMKLSEVDMPTIKAIASALLNAGVSIYYCTIDGQKVAITKQ